MQPDPPDPIVIDEILPPRAAAFGQTAPGRAMESEVARHLAHWLDNWLRIPGTNFKIGLDPLLALFPVIGSTLASGGGLIILIEAVRSGVSFAVLLRMAGHMLLNALFDYLPGIGPIASAFFKSNLRNLRLLQAWQAGHQDQVKRRTWQLFGLLGLVMLLLAGMIFGLFLLYVRLLAQLFHG